MARLSEREKKELLEDAMSMRRRRDFRRLEKRRSRLPPDQYLAFLTSASRVGIEKHANRPLMTGDKFLI